jgi:hypothetical protein
MSTLFNKEATKMTMDEIRTVLKRRKAATVAKATGPDPTDELLHHVGPDTYAEGGHVSEAGGVSVKE